MQTRFATTSWTKVLSAREASTSEARQALEGLCRVYWYPVYAFVRRQGNDAEDSRDLTQAYFAELLEKGYLHDYDPQRGRFRVFLMASVRHFLSKERDKALAWKRGGRADVVSLDAQEVDGRYRHEPVDRLTPEQIFERRWALTVLERALARLRREQEDLDRGREFARLEGFLTGEQLRLWPVPDVTKTPLHLRPHEELLAVLRSHTNLRAVPNAKSPSGYRGEPEPFRGWATLPEW